ncbi:hypothetical protein T492DRAFT_1072253, partial [Pavlovales sp. CCMP2436]
MESAITSLARLTSSAKPASSSLSSLRRIATPSKAEVPVDARNCLITTNSRARLASRKGARTAASASRKGARTSASASRKGARALTACLRTPPPPPCAGGRLPARASFSFFLTSSALAAFSSARTRFSAASWARSSSARARFSTTLDACASLLGPNRCPITTCGACSSCGA